MEHQDFSGPYMIHVIILRGFGNNSTLRTRAKITGTFPSYRYWGGGRAPGRKPEDNLMTSTSRDLKQTELLLANAVKQAPVPIAVVNSDMTIEVMNHAAREILGLSSEDASPGILLRELKTSWRIYDADGGFIPFEQAPMVRALKGEITVRKEVRIVRKDGTERWQMADAEPIYNHRGNLIGAFVVFSDITERRQVQKALLDVHRELEQRVEKRTAELVQVNAELRREINDRLNAEQSIEESRRYAENIINTVRNPLVVLDEELKVVSASRSFYKTFRLTPAQIQGKRFYSINKNQWDISGLKSLLEQIIPKQVYFENFEIEHRFDHLGHKILHLNARRVYDERTQTKHILLVIEDVTEQILVERDRAKREQRRKAAAEIALLGHWELDLLTNTIFWSDEIYHIFDLEYQEFEGTYEAFLDKVHPDDLEFVDKAYTLSVENKTIYDIKHRLLMKDGSIKYVHEKCKTEYDQDGKPLRSLGTVQDVTEQTHKKQQFAGIIGRTKEMQELFDTILELADVNIPVLIQGESGTGKELVAAAIHNKGLRAKKPFVPLNCSALPEGLLESELFGHVKGSFTGAVRDKKGRFELADGGTLFLDEVADLPKVVQAKLLRVLQEGSFQRVGDEKTITVDVRLISAANRDLKQEVKKGHFRDDLFYRISVVPIYMPPLRDRKNDIPLLLEHSLKQAVEEGQFNEGISKEALGVLIDYPWPGNVRELQSAICFALIKSKGKEILPDHLPVELNQYKCERNYRGPSCKLREENVRTVLIQTGGNKSRAAKLLGIGRATLYRFLSEHPHVS